LSVPVQNTRQPHYAKSKDKKINFVYASVDAYDQLHLSSVSSKIVDFKREWIRIDERKSSKTTPFYDSALKGDLSFGILPKQGGDRQMHS
jgi:hypothetical protein